MKSVGFSQACEIAGVKPGTVRQWRKRARDSAAGTARGDQRASRVMESEWFAPADGRVDASGVLHLAIVASLVNAGVPPWDAAEAAWYVTELASYEGNFPFGIAAGDDPPPRPERRAGEVFSAGMTVLTLASRPDKSGYDARVLNLADRQDKTLISSFSPGSVVLALEIGPVAERVGREIAQATSGTRDGGE